MKKTLINNFLIIGRIIFPVILFATIIPNLMDSYGDHLIIMLFGIAIVLFNPKKVKYRIILSLLIAIALSYIVYFVSILLSGLIKYLFFMKGDIDKKVDGFVLGMDVNTLLFLIPATIIAPILMFYVYRILFKIKKTDFILIGWITIFLLIFIEILRNVYNYPFSYTYWQIIMFLALQILLYPKELKNLFIFKDLKSKLF